MILKKVAGVALLWMPVLLCQSRISISNVLATNIDSSSATITWRTNVPADSTVQYGLTVGYSDTAVDASRTTQHSITLHNLLSNTIYDYRVLSSTWYYGTVSSTNISFKTVAIAPTTQPPSQTPPPSLWTQIASDMTGQHEANPHGVPLSWDWATGPVIEMGNNANGWKAITSWGGVYEASTGNPATNTRVNIRNMQTFFLQKSTGKWLLLQDTDYPDGAAYLEDFSGDISKPGDVRKEPDGSISVKAGGGYNFHFYPSDRATINPNDIGGILIILEARLIVDNSALPDDRSSAKYLCGAGADYYPSLTGGWPGNLSYNPGVGIGKMKLVQPYWRFFAMTTLNASQLAANPPPVNLNGILP